MSKNNISSSDRIASIFGPGVSREPLHNTIDWGNCRVLQGGAGESSERVRGTVIQAALPPRPANDLSEGMLNQLVADEDEPLLVVDTHGTVLFANEAYLDVADRSSGMLPQPDQHSPSSATEIVADVLEEIATTRSTIRSEEKILVDGEPRHYHVAYRPVASDAGELVAVAIIFRDVTAQKTQLMAVNEAQQRFKDFARATSDWFWETDRSMALTVLSERFTALTGQPIAMVLGMQLADIGLFKPNLKGESTVVEAIRRRTSFRDQLFEIKNDDGRNMRFHLSGVPVFERGSGDFLGYRGAGQDVTEHYRQELEGRRVRQSLEQTLEELREKNSQLDEATVRAEKALRAKNEFLAAMSHELRTPLNAIIGFAEAMKLKVYGDLNDQYQTYSGDIHRAGRHLLGLIEDVLDVAVIESGEISLSPTLIPLSEIIGQATSLCRQRAEAADIDITGLDSFDSFDVYVDERRATQIFVNLITNAIKFTPPGGKIGCEAVRAENDRVAVTVWDTGVGIAHDKQSLIFEKFQQVEENVYSRRTEGTGLGLHISRELARRMGGDITVSSAPGEGSRFTVALPLAG